MTVQDPAACRPNPKRRVLSRWYLRMPLKWLILAGVGFIVLFPHLGQFRTDVARLRDLQALIEPDAPEVAGLEDEMRTEWGKYQSAATAPASRPSLSFDELPPERMLRTIEWFVFRKVRYAWDWDTWGNADYIPTVHEMFAKAAEYPDRQLREDCDGRAVVAASLMKRMGYQPVIVADLVHMWVATPEGEWMAPGGPKVVVATAEGTRLDLRAALRVTPRFTTYGVAVFPLARELVILITAYLLMLHRRTPRWQAAVAGVLLLQGLLFMRCDVPVTAAEPSGLGDSWPGVVGVIHVAVAFVILLRGSYRARRLPPAGQSPEASGQPASSQAV